LGPSGENCEKFQDIKRILNFTHVQGKRQCFGHFLYLIQNQDKRKGKGKEKGKDLVIVNENAVLHEMARFGSGIIVGMT
jgi:hypothetical protein